MTVLPHSLLLYCTAMVAHVYQKTYISSALWRQCKNKITAHLPFSSQPPPTHTQKHRQKYIDPKHKI